MARRGPPLSFFALSALSALLGSATARAEPRPDLLELGAGVGYTLANDSRRVEESGSGMGLWLGGTYRRPLTRWFVPSVYAEAVATSRDKDGCGGCLAETRALFVGTQARLILPVPYFSPFLELGVGVGAGRFETLTREIDRKLTSVAFHIPLTLGVMLGRQSDVSVGLRYLVVPRAEQIAGALAVSLTFPIER